MRALAISVLALAIPLTAAVVLPEWFEGDGTLLIWLPVLLPAFLLSYHKGWAGASLALAAGMATLAVSQVEVLLLDVAVPGWNVTFGLVTILLVVTLGSGWLAELLLREREKAEEAALTDPLTGLPNRRHAMIFMEAAWGASLRGRDISVALFDLDRFKGINDEHGHAEGDKVIQAFAGILADRGRRMDISARFGGEEFISILLDCNLEQARLFAEEIRGRLEALHFGWGQVTVSAGIASIEEGMRSPDVLIAAADRALYTAKEDGRNQVRIARKAQARPRRRTQSSEDDLARAAELMQGLDVLLVDDDEGSLHSTAKVLTKLGCVVQTAASARAAVDALKSDESIALLITDIVMPDMSGFTLVDLAMKVRSDLPVLYVSGYPQEEVYWGGTPGARSGFLSKPIEIEDLQAAIFGLTDRVRVSQELVAEPDPSKQRRTAEAKSPPSRTTPPARVPGRILILDDDTAVVRSLSRLFAKAGYERPHGITDPKVAITELATGAYDLLILDLHMPQIDGFQVLASLVPIIAPGEYFPVLVLTGDDDPMVRQQALAAGAMDFLNKPFDPAEAEARVANLLQTRFLNQRVVQQRNDMEDEVLARTAELADTRSEILHRLARAAEYRDDVTGRHATRVGMLSSRLAAELGMDPQEVDLIRRTAPLHDVGKIGVADSVLLKPGALSDTEYAHIKTHTVIGAEILGGSAHRILVVARDIALSHHERWDGDGYPEGRKGSEIPMEARIVAVADTFDVISHSRPYKEARSPTEAVEELVRCSGTHFDPEVIMAFQAICERVGIDKLHDVADPIDPWRDTTGPDEAPATTR